jgi:hypothetical protein
MGRKHAVNLPLVARPFVTRTIAGIAALALVLGGSLAGASVASADDLAAAPVVTVSPNSSVDTTVSNTFTITGSGFTGPGAANGAYVNIGATSAWTPGTVPDASKFVTSGWVMPSSVVNGAFTTTLVVDANTLDPAQSYSVSTFAAHGLSITDRSLDTLTAITLKPAVPAANPTVTITPATDVDPTVENTFTISGTGFTGPGAANGAYVNIGSVDAWTPGTVPDASKFVKSGWVMPRSVVNGAFTTTLVIPANTLDRSLSYGVSTFAAHALSATDRTLDTFTPFTFKALPTPTVTVSKSTITTGGETITVTGTGFSPNAPATSGTRAPLAGKFGGVYVTFGKFADVWKASESAPSTARAADRTTTKWVMDGEDIAGLGAAGSAAVAINADGSFTLEVPVKAGFSGELATGNYGIYTYPGAGATYAPFETYTPLVFETPQVTITPSANVDPTVENTFTISGTGFTGAGAVNGTYVNIGSTEAWTPGTVPDASKFVKSGWVMPRSIVNGAFTTTMVIPANTLDRDLSYGVSTFAAHALSATNRTLDTFTAFAFKAPPAVTVSKSTVSPAGETITVTGTGFTPSAPATTATRPPLAGKFGGVYVTFGKFADVWKASEGATAAARVADRATTKWVMNAEDIAALGAAGSAAVAIGPDGTFTLEIPVKPGFSGELATGNYGIYTYPAGGTSYAPFETYSPITFTEVVAPKVTVTPSTKVDTTVANTFTISGTGFTGAGAANGAYVNIGSTEAWTPGTVPDASSFVSSGWVMPRSIVDGAFTTTLVVPANRLDPSLSYGVATFAAHGLSITDRTLDTFTPFTLKAIAATPTSTTLTATPSAITVGESTILAAQVAPVTAGSYTFTLGSTILGSVAASNSGAATFTVQNLPVGTQQLTATFAPASSAFAASAGNASVQVNAVTPPVVGPPAVGAGSLTWGVKQSFREYVAGPIAKGDIVTTGVGRSGGAFVFGQSEGGSFDRATGVGTSNYSGSVRFTGHAGILDVTLSNPVVRVDSATSGTLLVTVGGSQIAFATLNLAAGSLSTPNNTVSYAGVPATLTAQGASVFSLNGSGFYEPGTALDPVSFVIGAPKAAATGSATVASFAATTNTPAKTVPATTGATVTTADGSAITEGGEVTITASGFQPNERNILVVVYSDPVLLASNVAADASGTATWTGRLPAGLTGDHTLTLQGSVDRGVAISIAAKAATTAVAGCVVDDAALTWGFKESFRSYISGSIANGEWTVADGATYAVPNFGFSGGTGAYDAETAAGLLSFAGSITFTGHGGILNTTVSNPQLQLVDETSAVLLLDISGTTQDGAEISRTGVEFGAVDLSGAVTDENGSISITDAPAVLTAAGADAFGTYPEGEALDPITATFSVAADCALPAEEEETPVTTMAQDETETAVVTDEASDLGWIIWAVLALIVIAAIVAVVLVLRRRAAARS